jgi:serine/threonine-protein kinase PknK
MTVTVEGPAQRDRLGREGWTDTLERDWQETLADAQVVRTICVGGGGVVVLAHQAERPVVVKCLRHREGPRGMRRGQARREAAMLKAAQGPHVVKLQEAVVSASHTFLVMEHLPHATLRWRLGQPWAAVDLVAAGLGVTAALARLHTAEILFNDFKLRNLGIGCGPSRGRPDKLVVNLLDFGHARTVAASRARSRAAGSVDYAAPETLRPGEISPSSDVWAWGRSWHLLATGDYFTRFRSFDELTRDGRPPLPPVAEASRVALPPALAALIDACVASDPGHRPADGAELHERLHAVAAAEWGPALEEQARFVWLSAAEPATTNPARRDRQRDSRADPQLPEPNPPPEGR